MYTAIRFTQQQIIPNERNAILGEIRYILNENCNNSKYPNVRYQFKLHNWSGLFMRLFEPYEIF